MTTEPQVIHVAVLTLGAGIGCVASCAAFSALTHQWTGILVAPVMLVSHAMTFYYLQRRIRHLEQDLKAIRTAKKALLGAEQQVTTDGVMVKVYPI